MKYFWFFLFLMGTTGVIIAQTSDEELAAQYYGDGEYDKAEILYKKLLKRDAASVYVYQNYLDCLIKLKSFDDAEKMVSRQIRKFDSKPLYAVDLGYIYGLQGEDKKAAELFENLIKNTGNSIPETDQLAMAFLKREQNDYAIETYLKGRKVMGAQNLFTENLIDLYYLTKNYRLVITECLELLAIDDRSFNLVQSKLIRLVDQDIETLFLHEKAALYLQKNPEKVVFDDLMMWVFVQQKNFNAALRQATAMDKRNRTEGRSLVNLAQICVSNNAFDVAVLAFQKVIDFGENGYFYMAARMGLLETSFKSLQLGIQSSNAKTDELIGQYNDFISEFGSTWNTAPTIKQLSDIYIFHKHNLDKGISLIEALVDIPRLQPHLKASYKLSLGDAYLMRNEVWDAALLYGQVDKDFKEDPLGQEAKFRNARLSYFQADFEWASDQLDVLKTATSQLIANNAIELALTIQDNSGLDSNTDALQAYAKAQLLFFQNRYDDCLRDLSLIPFKFPNHSLEDEIYFTKAKVMSKMGDYDKAEEYFLNVINYFGDDILADNALYELATLYQYTLNQPDKAITMLEKLIFKYSGSLFVVEARKRYKKLKTPLESIPSESP
jgi:tetratricopeptide (TPR) repeat protein